MTPELTALLRACKEEPTDDLPRRVLADWLEEHGQAERAEFVRLQLRFRDNEYEYGADWSADTAAQKARELRLLREHAGDWLGGSYAFWRWCDMPTVAGRTVSARFSRGLARVQTGEGPLAKLGDWPAQVLPWLEGYESGHLLDAGTWRELVTGPYLEPFSDLQLGWGNADPSAVVGLLERTRPAGLRLTAEVPGAALLRTLAGLGWLRPRHLSVYPDDTSLPGWAALAASEVLAEVRSLDCQFPPESDGLSRLAAAPHLGKLTDLCLVGDRIEGPTLRELFHSEGMANLTDLLLSSYSGEGNPEVATALADSPLRALERLNLNSNPLPDSGVVALASSAVLDSVRSLDLYDCHLSVGSARALAGSEHLGGLTGLVLSYNEIGDAGMLALAGSPHLGRLRRLEVDLCGLSDESIRALAGSLALAGLASLRCNGNRVTDAALAALASSTTLTGLRSLSFSHIPDLGAGFRALLRSPVVANLVRLDLSTMTLGPENLAALADSPHLGNLREFSINAKDGENLGALCDAPWMDGLIELSIHGGAIGPEGVMALTRGLRSGRLARLDLAGQNHVGPAGAKALLDWPGLAEVVELTLDGPSIGADLKRELERVVRHR